MVVPQYELSVNQDVATKYECGNASICQLDRAIVRKEGGHESKQNERPEASEQIWHPGGEIILRLTGEERQSDKDPKRQQQSFQDHS